MRRRGFTMMEILFVISIIAVLAAILFPVFARARESARKHHCANNLMQIGAALSLYARDYDGRFPKENNNFRPLLTFTKSRDVFWCPSDSDKDFLEYEPGARDGKGTARLHDQFIQSSYVYKGGMTSDNRGDSVISGEVKAFHVGLVNVLYLGGYVRPTPEALYKPVVKPRPKPGEQRPGMNGPMGPGMPPMPGPSGPPMPPVQRK